MERCIDRCPKCGRPAEIVERNSRNYDPDRNGIGTSSKLGARYNTYMPVPRAFTEHAKRRYLFLIAAMNVPDGYRCTLTSLWQGLIIGSYQPVGVGADATTQLVYCHVSDPACMLFPDGNVTWSMVWRKGRAYNDALPESTPQPGMYPGLRATESSLLYIPPLSPRYTPPNAGDPGGDPVGSLTGFTHLRYAPSGTYPSLRYQVDGPGQLAFLVSIWQTNPLTRRIWTPPEGMDLGGFSREQRFIWALDTIETPGDTKARWTHVAGGFTAQERPLCCGVETFDAPTWRGGLDLPHPEVVPPPELILPPSARAPREERPS